MGVLKCWQQHQAGQRASRLALLELRQRYKVIRGGRQLDRGTQAPAAAEGTGVAARSGLQRLRQATSDGPRSAPPDALPWVRVRAPAMPTCWGCLRYCLLRQAPHVAASQRGGSHVCCRRKTLSGVAAVVQVRVGLGWVFRAS